MADLVGQCRLKIERAQCTVGRELLIRIEYNVGLSDKACPIVENSGLSRFDQWILGEKRYVLRLTCDRDQADAVAG